MGNSIGIYEKSLKINILGYPIAWARPALAMSGRKAWLYDEQKQVKKEVRFAMQEQWNEFFDNPGSAIHDKASSVACAESLCVQLTFLFPPKKKSAEKLKKPRRDIAIENARLWGMIPHNDVADIDNLAKFALDCGNGILWRDDRIIDEIIIKKKFSNKPRTIIEIMTKQNFSKSSKTRKILELFTPQKLEELANDVKKFSYLSDKSIINNSSEGHAMDQAKWQQKTAVLLADFAEAHGEELDKINQFAGLYFPMNGKPIC